MIELSIERVDQILHQETPKKEELATILRGIYTRYMCLYEKYFADIDALNDDTIADLNKYHGETKSLVKYFYMDIPQDICRQLETFDNEYNAKLLGSDWHRTLCDSYADFRAKNEAENKSAKCLKAEFSEQILKAFYDAMDYIFREGFGTGSKADELISSGLASLLFGEE